MAQFFGEYVEKKLKIMEHEEVFAVNVDGINYEIRSPMPVGPNDADHQVWRSNKLLFVIAPHLQTCDEPCWKLNKDYADRGIDLKLVSQIGEAIERHYL